LGPQTSATRTVLPTAANAAHGIGGILPIVSWPRVLSTKAWRLSKRAPLTASRCECLGHFLGLSELIDDVPREQLLNAIDRMIGDALEYVLEIALRIDAIKFATFDDSINDRGALTAGVGAKKQIMFSIRETLA
jgi:hypothetical protein